MPAYVIRVWLPDRPGALGAVASRVGAVGADVVGIDIIERGAGRAVDELIFDLPDAGLVDLLLAEIGEVDGVDVESIRPLSQLPVDPAVMALEVARRAGEASGADRAHVVLVGAVALLAADWAALVDTASSQVVARHGEDAPGDGWLVAFTQGATTEGGRAGLDDVAVAVPPGGTVAVVVARDHSPLRGREQQVLDSLAALI
ncbi:MAG: ACT domain-containing protein [Microthrixaceae bacterium]